jgi:indolepyruvate ferredoxin oxidoreductase alpha subunit
MERQEVMMGNHAIARGFIEAGIEVAAAYPGTPSSEILPGILDFARRDKVKVHAEWSTNERCALEVAFGAALLGRKSVCLMKQVGLNVAFPSLLRAREKTIKGGLVIVSCDDPGPQSSQTEQDTRLLALLFHIPVFDPASPREAGDAAYEALRYSFSNKTPVILRSTHRVSHAREAVTLYEPGTREASLEEGLQRDGGSRLGIIASGMPFSVVSDVLDNLAVRDGVSLYKVTRIDAAPPGLDDFVRRMEKILVLEETDQVLEALVAGKSVVLGRGNGYVPGAGELTYDVVREIVEKALEEAGIGQGTFRPDGMIEEALKETAIRPRPPQLCAGCPHRASFYAMRQAFPDAVFPGDIGCYTLGISMGAVDTCLDMGGGVNLASGFFDTFQQDGALRPIIASVGDSTFFHACLSALYDAVLKEKRFILVIMDNGITAMTGLQPTPQMGLTADGSRSSPMPIEEVVRGFGIDYLRILDPYDVPLLTKTIRETYGALEGGRKGPAVILARRECLLYAKGKVQPVMERIDLEDDCIGCKSCLNLFDCPAFLFDEETKKVKIDERLCTRCGTCLFACTMKREGKGLFQFQDNYFLTNRI